MSVACSCRSLLPHITGSVTAPAEVRNKCLVRIGLNGTRHSLRDAAVCFWNDFGNRAVAQSKYDWAHREGWNDWDDYDDDEEADDEGEERTPRESRRVRKVEDYMEDLDSHLWYFAVVESRE